jgi:hypothetical protein
MPPPTRPVRATPFLAQAVAMRAKSAASIRLFMRQPTTAAELSTVSGNGTSWIIGGSSDENLALDFAVAACIMGPDDYKNLVCAIQPKGGLVAVSGLSDIKVRVCQRTRDIP